MKRIFISIVGLLFACGAPLRADPPAISYLFPAGGQRGKTVELQVGGLALNQNCNAEMIGKDVAISPKLNRITVPRFEGPILPLPDSQRQEDYPVVMGGKIEIAAKADVGIRGVRCWTSQGVTLPAKFEIGDLPEMVEKEIEGEPLPEKVAMPITINGRIYPREDIDIWTVDLKRGETLYCNVSALRLGSPLEAQLEIRDSKNQRLAEAQPRGKGDPQLQFTAPADGTFQVRIHDVQFGGGPAHVYRLTLTTQPPAANGYHPKSPIVQETAEAVDPIKANQLPIPGIGKGAISQPGEQDRWSFSARKGETIEIDLHADRIGSRLLGQIVVEDSQGKSLGGSADGPAADAALRFQVPNDGLYFIRVSDRFKNRGGSEFKYLLEVRNPKPGFELRVAAPSLTIPRNGQVNLRVTAVRHGNFNGPIQLEIPGLPAGVNIPKDLAIGAGQNQIDVPFKCDANVSVISGFITIRGTGWMQAPFSAAMLPLTSTAVFRDEADDFGDDRIRFAVAIPTPFKIVGEYSSKQIPRGTTYTRQYKLERTNFDGPIEVTMADRQARHLQGVTGPTLTVAEKQNNFDYPIELPPWMETGRTCRVCVLGTATVKDFDGTSHVVTYSSREQNDQIIAVVEPERLGVEIDRSSLRAIPGAVVTLPLKIRRGKAVSGDAKVEAVSSAIPGIEIVTLIVPAERGEGTLTLRLAKDLALPQAQSITIRASVMDGKFPVVAETTLQLLPPRQ